MLLGLDGDAQAQRRLLASLAVLLRAFYARRLGASDQDVEDLVQDCLIAMHLKRETFDRRGPFTPWAYAIARYKLIDHYRRRRVRAWAPIDDLDEFVASERADDTMAARDVKRLLDDLPTNQARAIRATRLEGASTLEAAQETGLSPALVKVSVHRGLKTLMARMNGREGAP